MKRTLRLLLAAAAPLLLAGCFNPFSPEILSQRVTSTAPFPTTPQNAVRLFEWCWKNRGIDEYRELFTEDYEFLSAGLDSAGNTTREVQARRDDEIQTAENMFIGSAERPPAAKITLDFDRNLIPFQDTRENKQGEWFRTIRTSVNLKVNIDESNAIEVTGFALFYLERGDTAAIPAELKARGFKKDPARWWISRWEDETLAPEGLRGGDTATRPAGTLLVRRITPTGVSAVTPMTMAELKRYFTTSLALRSPPGGPGAAASPPR